MSEQYFESKQIGTMLRRRSERGVNGDPLLSVTQDRGVIQQESVGRRNVSSADKKSYWRVYPGDIVYNTMRMWQGASASSDHFGIVSPAYTVCEPIYGVNSKYLSYLFKLPENIAIFRSRSQGIVSDVWNLRFRELKKIRINYINSIEHQSKISKILSSLDETTKQTKALITNRQQVKTGLMHDLFTRGIMPNGQLRPPREEAPQLYKESPLGWIPKEWGISTLGQVFEIQLRKMLNKHAKTGKYSAPYVGNRAVQWDRVDISQLEEMDFSAKERTKFRLVPGDLLVCEGGEVGRTAMWNDEIDECYYQKAIHRLRPRGELMLPRYMLGYMHFACLIGRFRLFTTQSSIAHLTQEKLSTIRMIAPHKSEQESIVELFDAQSQEVGQNEVMLTKLQEKKSGLMHDLLTGRVRVPEALLKKAAAST